MDWSLSRWKQLVSFCANSEKTLVPQIGLLYSIRESKHSQHSAPNYSVHKYIYRSCMSVHLTLRYCSCNTYLLHRRAVLKATTWSILLMWNWTLGNNEPLAVSTYISGVVSYCALNKRNNWPIFQIADGFVLRKLSVIFFSQFTINQLSCSDCVNESKSSYWT